MNTVTAEINGFGTIRVYSKDLDWAINKFLPASPKVLWSLYEEWMGVTYASEFREGVTVTDLLIMLAAQAHGEVPDQPEEPVPYHQIARIACLRYRPDYRPDPLGGYVFVEGFGFDKAGKAVRIKPPDSCRRIPRQRPASYLIRAWPDIREQVSGRYVSSVLALGTPEPPRG